MRKIVPVIICSIFLSFSVEAKANVTNQLNEISSQLENLEQVIQWFVDNEVYLNYFVDGSYVTEYIMPLERNVNDIRNYTLAQLELLALDVYPDIASIQANISIIKDDLAALSAAVVTHFANVGYSINSLANEVESFRSGVLFSFSEVLTAIGLNNPNFLLQELLTSSGYQENTLSWIFDTLTELEDYTGEQLILFQQIYSALLALQDTVESQGAVDITVDIVIAGLEELFEDLETGLEQVFSSLSIDLRASINSAIAQLTTVISILDNFWTDFRLFRSDFQYFLQNWQTFQTDQLEMQSGLFEFLSWYQGYFYDGLQFWQTSHIEWMKRQEEFLKSEAQYHTNQLEFLTGDYSLPTDSDEPYLEELEKALIEEEPEVPDEKIYQAQEEVKSDMEDVEHELTGAMDLVDSAFTGFLGDVKFNWGSFNPVLSFSYTLPFHDYTMQLTYDFSESDLRTPCRTVSTGIWGIVLFVQSFLAISGVLRGLTEN